MNNHQVILYSKIDSLDINETQPKQFTLFHIEFNHSQHVKRMLKAFPLWIARAILCWNQADSIGSFVDSTRHLPMDLMIKEVHTLTVHSRGLDSDWFENVIVTEGGVLLTLTIFRRPNS